MNNKITTFKDLPVGAFYVTDYSQHKSTKINSDLMDNCVWVSIMDGTARIGTMIDSEPVTLINSSEEFAESK